MSREDRIAANERIIREANEEAELLARDAGGGADEEVEFHCECGEPDCDVRVILTVAEFQRAHEQPHRFIVAQGHDHPDMERVVARHGSWDVVEKFPEFRIDMD
jgi:hypothetical protein